MNRNRDYDLVVGLGQSCACTQALRVSGLQFASFPFDWIGGPSLREPVRIIVSDFMGWMREDAFMHIGDRLHPQGRIYRNVETELIYSHEVPLAGRMSTSYAEMCEKYERRIKRFQRLMKASSRVLMVRMGVPGLLEESDEDLREAQACLAKKFGGVTLDLVYLVNRNGLITAREHWLNEHVCLTQLDFSEKNVMQPNPLVPDLNALEPYLRTFSCRDYRSRTERTDFNGRKDYRSLFTERIPLPPRPNKIWTYGPGAFELKPLDFSEAFKENNRFREEIDDAMKSVLDSGIYRDGDQRRLVEREIAHYTGAPHVVVFSSISEVQIFLQEKIGIDDSFIKDVSALMKRGVARDVLGEECRAAIAYFNEKSNLNVPGSIGCVMTGDAVLCDALRMMVQTGDELSSAILRVRIRHLDGDNARRQAIDCRYKMEIHGEFNPSEHERGWTRHSCVGYPISVASPQLFVETIRRNGIDCAIVDGIILLPNDPTLSNDQVGRIIKVFNECSEGAQW